MTMERAGDLKRKARVAGLVSAIIAVLAIVAIVVLIALDGAPASPVAASLPAKPVVATAAVCEPQHQQVDSNNEGSRVIANFAQLYAEAVANEAEIGEAQRKLILTEAGKDAQALSIFSYAFGLYENPANWKELQEVSCLSEEGKRLHAKLEGALTARGVTFEEGLAPETFVNSGVYEGTYGVSRYSGISGDRRAIKATMKDGGVVYILIRCANPVYPGKPDLPEVPTDEPKDISQAPQNQGNLPEQQKPNVLQAQPSHRQPTEPANPPATYVPPAAPAPQPPATQAPSNPRPVPTPDPAPAPTREPQAPAPTNPVGPSDPGGGCVVLPGVEDCS